MTAISRKLPWFDRSGRFSPLKTAVFVSLFLPGIAAAVNLADGAFGAEPSKQVIHALGLWAIRLILVALAITPAMQIFKLPRLLIARRMIGVAAFTYALFHFSAYIVQQHFDLAKVASEIYSRLYLTIGFVTLLVLLALAVTSTDAMIRRMGSRRWTLLHKAIYVGGALAFIHFIMHVKLDATEPAIFAGFFIWLMLYRAALWTLGQKRAVQPLTLLAVSVAAGALTMAGEAGGYALFTHIDASRVFDANFSLIAGLRPGWYALIFGLAVSVAALIRARFAPARVARAVTV